MHENIRTIIVEDELPIREEIIELAIQIEDLQIVGIGKNGIELEELLDHKKPDIALLDIELPIKDTMSVLSEKKNLPYIIFISAYEMYAPRAFEMAAVDYLVKPLKKERFEQAVSRAIDRIKADRLNNDHTQNSPEIIWIRESERIVPIPVNDIIFLEARDKTTLIYMHDTKYFMVSRPLTGILQKLLPANFLQIHRKYAVKLSAIMEMQPLFHGRYEITLNGFKEKLPVSRRYAMNILKEL